MFIYHLRLNKEVGFGLLGRRSELRKGERRKYMVNKGLPSYAAKSLSGAKNYLQQ